MDAAGARALAQRLADGRPLDEALPDVPPADVPRLDAPPSPPPAPTLPAAEPRVDLEAVYFHPDELPDERDVWNYVRGPDGRLRRAR